MNEKISKNEEIDDQEMTECPAETSVILTDCQITDYVPPSIVN